MKHGEGWLASGKELNRLLIFMEYRKGFSSLRLKGYKEIKVNIIPKACLNWTVLQYLSKSSQSHSMAYTKNFIRYLLE